METHRHTFGLRRCSPRSVNRCPPAGGAADATTRHCRRSPVQTLENHPARQERHGGSGSGRAGFHRRCAEHAVGCGPDLYQNAARILYLAVVLDVFSRKVVGWQMADTKTTDFRFGYPGDGLWRRDMVRDRLIHHSDKGSQYTSLRVTQRLADAGAAPSTGSVGDSYDNAMAESFFGSLKTEPIYRHTWTSRHDAELAILAWIEGWYNPEPHHHRIRHAQPRRIRSSLLR
jgi:transposase InsO family protein